MAGLFSARIRQDASPKRLDETTFAFYDRVEGRFFDRLRGLLKDWFERYPSKDQAHLRGRLESADQYASAVWELYLHERFLRAGLTVEVDAEVAGGLTPDFRLTVDGRIIAYVEATIDHVSQELQRKADARDRFAHVLKTKVAGRSHALICDFAVVGENTPPLKQLVADLDATMEANLGRRFRRRSNVRDWRVTIEGMPLPSPSQGAIISLTWGGGGSYTETRLNPVRGPIIAKGKKYSGLEAPLVVAISTFGHFSPIGPADVASALYGSFTTVLDHHLEEVRIDRNKDGVLNQGGRPRKTGVSGVVFVQSFDPAVILTAKPPMLYVNDYASHALQVGQLPFDHRRIDPEDHGVHESWSFYKPEHLLFDLPEDWPGCNPFEEWNRQVTCPHG